VIDAPDPPVREFLARAIAAGQFPGAAAVWGRSGESSTTCVAGQAEVCPVTRDVDHDTWFDLASLTKPLVTATLVLLAFREGALAPDTTVGEVLRETDTSPVGDLEVRHLLTHQSGLPAWLPLYCLAEGRPGRMGQVLQRIVLEGPPGQRVVYSCVGYVVLGLMLETVSDSGIADLFERDVLVPADLVNDLGFNPDPDVRHVAAGATVPLAEQRMVLDLGLDPSWIPDVAPGLPDDGNARFLGGAAGNAGLFGTAGGVRRLTAEYLGREATVLRPEEVAAAVESQTVGCGQERGFGWQISTSSGCSAGFALPATAFGHTGYSGASVWAEPENGGIWVLLTNRNHPSQRGIDLNPVRRRFHAITQSP